MHTDRVDECRRRQPTDDNCYYYFKGCKFLNSVRIALVLTYKPGFIESAGYISKELLLLLLVVII